MPEKPNLAEQVFKWEPSEIQRVHGRQVFAARLIKEGLRFEAAGNAIQAKLRFIRARSYCQANALPYPPLSMTPTAIVEEVARLNPAELPPWKSVRGTEMPPTAEELRQAQLGAPPPPSGASPRRGRPKGSKNKPKSFTAAQGADAVPLNPNLKAEQKIRGQKVFCANLCSRGEWAKAKDYATRLSLPWPPFEHIKVPAECGPSGSPPSGEVEVKTEASLQSEPAAPANVEAGPRERPASPDPLKDTRPIHMLSLREQLVRQLAELDAAERAAGAHTAAPMISESAPDVDPKEVFAKEAEVNEPAVRLTNGQVMEGRTIRKARVHNFAINPRLASIQFLDGKKEMASLWLPHSGQALRLNDRVDVMLERGQPLINAIYEIVRRPV